MAETVAGGASHLVTRDEALLRSADEIEHLVGVRVLSPANFLLSIQAESADGFEPQFIKTSGFAIQRRSSVPANSVLARFTHQALNERAAELRDRISGSVGEPGVRIEEVTAADASWALAAHFTDGSLLRVGALRSLADRRAYSLLRQLIHGLRRRGVAEGAHRVEIADVVDQTVSRALRDEGFVNVDGLWRAELSRSVIGCDDSLPRDLGLPDVGTERLPPSLISRIEAERWAPEALQRRGTVPCRTGPAEIRPDAAWLSGSADDAHRDGNRSGHRAGECVLHDPPTWAGRAGTNPVVGYRRRPRSGSEGDVVARCR